MLSCLHPGSLIPYHQSFPVSSSAYFSASLQFDLWCWLLVNCVLTGDCPSILLLRLVLSRVLLVLAFPSCLPVFFSGAYLLCVCFCRASLRSFTPRIFLALCSLCFIASPALPFVFPCLALALGGSRFSFPFGPSLRFSPRWSAWFFCRVRLCLLSFSTYNSFKKSSR